MSRKHTLVAATVGLTAGLGLGITGLASAVGSSPTPSPSTTQAPGTQAPGTPPGPRDHDGPRGDHGMFGASGLVTAKSGSSITVNTHVQGTKTYGLTSATTYYVGKDKKSASDVAVGDVVAIELVDPTVAKPVAKQVTVLPAHLDGWVSKVDGSTITLTDESGFTRTIRTSSATTYTKDGVKATSAVMTVGTEVRARGTVDSNGTTLDATEVSVGRPAGGPGKGFGHMGGRMGGPMGGPMGGGFGGPMGTPPTGAPSGQAG